jgi:hypothetical protein
VFIQPGATLKDAYTIVPSPGFVLTMHNASQSVITLAVSSAGSTAIALARQLEGQRALLRRPKWYTCIHEIMLVCALSVSNIRTRSICARRDAEVSPR